MKEGKFRVAIVGGGIGGLALANSLQHAGIDYVLIEKAKSLDPQVGASIGILPNGARVLDQIGCFDDLAPLTVPMESTASHSADGTLIGEVSDTLSLMRRRTGYPVIFIDRQLLLRSLAHRILDSDRILLGSAVTSVDQQEDKATVHCADGKILDVDLVVGSDGVHSFVRQEMWRHADSDGEGDAFIQDKKAMSAEYKCLFGISTAISGMEPGQTDRTYAYGLSTLSYVGKEGRVYWFIFIKMDRTYYPPNIPKFTDDDVTTMIKENGSIPLRPGGKVTIADLYNRRVCCNLVAIEEAQYQRWSYGRLTCMGDSIHKMTPNLGAGASSAIESAAVLSNMIVSLASATKPSLSTIKLALEEYQNARTLRVGRAMAITNKLTRTQALQTRKDYIFAHYIAPRMDDVYAEAFSSFVIGAPVIDHLPIPKRSLRGTMPFNPKQGWGFEESTPQRMRRALPLLIIALFSFRHSGTFLAFLCSAAGLNVDFFESMARGLPQDFLAQKHLAVSIQSWAAYGLFLLEATRVSNKASLIQLPLLFGLGWHYLGFGVVAPMFLFLLHTQSPIEKFRASDSRLTDVSYTYFVGPIVFLFGILPRYLNYWSILGPYETYENANSAYGLVQRVLTSQPLTLLFISTLHFLIARFIRPSTIRSDRIKAVDKDVMPIRYSAALFATVTSLAWISLLVGLYDTAARSKTWSFPSRELVNIWSDADSFSLASAAMLWMISLTLKDLRDAGMVKVGAFTLAAVLTPILIWLGPGTTLVLGWWWREEILIHRRHQNAVVGQQK